MKRLHEAILATYNEPELRRMVFYSTGEKLDSIATGQNFTAVVFELLEWAERVGRLRNLIFGIKIYRRSHEKVRSLEVPTDHFFISYSRTDGSEFAAQLAEGLGQGNPPFPVWMDKEGITRDIIDEAIKTCKGLLFVMTDDSVRPSSYSEQEWSAALKYKRPIIPIRLHREVMQPPDLSQLPSVDFTVSCDAALTQLRSQLAEMGTPGAALQALKNRLNAARRELPRVEPQQRPRIEDEIRDLEQQIADQQRVVDDPEGASRRTNARIAQGLEQERKAEPSGTSTSRAKVIYQPPTIAPFWFQDRHVETAQIGDFLKDDSLRLLTVVGRAGIGKTAMVCRLLKSLEQGQLPDDGGPLDVGGIVYLSATGSHRVRVPDLLFAGLCQLLPEATARPIEGISKNPHIPTATKIQTLLEALPVGHTVVLMDNFEDVLETATGKFRDKELEEVLRAVLTLPQHGLKIILTSQLPLPQSLRVHPGRQRPLPLDKGLDSPYAENMLRAMDKDGTVGFKDTPESLLAEALVPTRGYPRALEALFNIRAADRYTPLEQILSDAKGLPPDEVVEVLVGEAFSRLDPLTQQVMQALAVYPCPVPPAAVDHLLQPYQPGIDSEPVLRRLAGMQFARRSEGHYYLHHVDRTYALSRVPDGRPEDWRGPGEPPYTRPALLHRGAEYFRKIRRDESTWRSLEHLGPLNSEFDLLFDSGDHEGALDVLLTMNPYLDQWGQSRLQARLAERLARGATDPVRATASVVAGLAHADLGETSQAIEYLKAGLDDQRLEKDSQSEMALRLKLAECYRTEGDYRAAEREYRHLLEAAEKNDVESLVTALLGLGSVAQERSSYAEAEKHYQRALHTWVSQTIVELVPEGEAIVVRPTSTFPPDLPIADPGAWHPTGVFFGEEGAEVPLFGIEVRARESEAPKKEEAPGGEEPAAPESIIVLPVQTTSLLADIWFNLASLYGETDRLAEASACCYLAGSMYEEVGDDSGTAQAHDLLRRLTAQVSDTEAGAIFAAQVTAQEENLRRAREANNRRLEISILENLAGSYLERSKVDDAEARYLELERLAAELDDPSLKTQVEIGLARIEWMRRRPDEAAAKLESLLKGRPLTPRTRTDVEYLLGQIESNRNRLDAATDHLLAASRGYAALGALPNLIDVECLLAAMARDRRDYEVAVRRLRSALQLAKAVGTPSLVTKVLCDLAEAYYWAGARDLALAAADEAAATAAKNKLPATAAGAHQTIGEIRLQFRQFELAEAAFQQALEAYRQVSNVYMQLYVLGRLSYLHGLSEKKDAELRVAQQAWEMAKDLSDLDEVRKVRGMLAEALSDCGLHAEAVLHAQAVADEDPSDAVAFLSLGWVLYEAGDFDRSLEASRRALELDPAQDEAIRNLGHAYLAKGLPEDAEREYRRAIQGRKGGENFVQTIKEVKILLARNPQVPRGRELLQLLEQEQEKLDAGEKSGPRGD
jgi:tetratricopeptide (TPR) repeat protein